jgi:Domain of unknown function (DUF4145)
MPVQPAPKKTRIYCNHCKQDTNHDLKGDHTASWWDEDAAFGEMHVYRLWVCMGCEHGLLQREHVNSDGETAFSYFPHLSRNELSAKPYAKLKPHLAAIYKESVTCYNSKALILCASGLRALLEGICQDKRIKGKNLKGKIEGLKARLPNKNIIRNLHHFRFMGNEAVHELAAPKLAELALAIGVIEDLLNFFYELDYKASQLREMRRSKKAKIVRPNKPLPATSIGIIQIK